MSVPAEVLTGINEAMVDGGAIAGLVLAALVGMHALKMIRQGVLEDRTYSDSRGNEYLSEADRDEAEARMGADYPDSEEWADSFADYCDRRMESWSESAEKDRQWNAATGWQDDESGRSRVVD